MQRFTWSMLVGSITLGVVVVVFVVFTASFTHEPTSVAPVFVPEVSNSILKGENQPKSSSFLVFPDMMLGRAVASVSQKNGGYEYVFANLLGEDGRMFSQYEFIIANLEGPITDFRARTQKSISFAFEPIVAEVLKNYGFDALSLANNHGNDQGSRGFEDTKKFLSEQGIGYFGNPVKEHEVESVLVQEVGSRKIGFIGFNLTDHVVDNKNLQAIIASTKKQSDFVVVFPHWGAEYQRYPTSSQKTWARLFVDAGADVVIGHHPHVVQIVEVYDGKPIFYSLGNFVFDQYFSQETQEGFGVGVVVDDPTVSYDLIPYTIPKSRPTLMSLTQRQIFFEALAHDSVLDKSHKEQLRLGSVVFVR